MNFLKKLFTRKKTRRFLLFTIESAPSRFQTPIPYVLNRVGYFPNLSPGGPPFSFNSKTVGRVFLKDFEGKTEYGLLREALESLDLPETAADDAVAIFGIGLGRRFLGEFQRSVLDKPVWVCRCGTHGTIYLPNGEGVDFSSKAEGKRILKEYYENDYKRLAKIIDEAQNMPNEPGHSGHGLGL